VGLGYGFPVEDGADSYDIIIEKGLHTLTKITIIRCIGKHGIPDICKGRIKRAFHGYNNRGFFLRKGKF
jgi:hypothetical protein